MPVSTFAEKNWNPLFRHRSEIPLPGDAELEGRLRSVLTPAALSVREVARRTGTPLNMRERVLTLPVMAAVVVSMVWRGMPTLMEVLRTLEVEGLLDAAPVKVSKQALSRRLQSLPATLFGELMRQVIALLKEQTQERVPAERHANLRRHFPSVWAADGSTLEALKKRLKSLKEEAGCVLGGKMMVLMDLVSLSPVEVLYEQDSSLGEYSFLKRLRAFLPKGGLLVLDRGFHDFGFFDACTEEGKYFLTRPKSNTALRVVEVLAEGAHFRDEIVRLGIYRSNRCKHLCRMISVLWKGVWYRYLTNVLDPKQLAAEEAVALYRDRWRIEDAFLQTKRLLGLSYLWVGDKNGVEIQVYATWIFYAVLIDLCQQVAFQLEVPLERISVEMVLRGLYHFSRAQQRADPRSAAKFLADHARTLGIVKAERKRHRESKQENRLIWEDALS